MQRFPAGTLDSRLSSFSNRGLGVIDVAAPGSTILSTFVAQQRLRHQERHLDGLAARGGRPRADEVGPPRLDPGADDHKLRQQADDKACSAATAGVPCVGPVEDNSYFGEGMVDALDAVS